MLAIKKIISGFAFLLVFSLAASSALAIQLSLSPSTQDVTLGDAVTVDVDISGLGDFSPDSLGVFDIDILFDPTILNFDSVLFGDPVLGDQLDLFGFGSFTDVTSGAGAVNLFELSFDLASDLDSLQAGGFTLASLTFNTLGVGSGALDIQINGLGDALGLPLTADTVSARVNVIDDSPPSPMPEPNVLWLLAVGLLGLFMNNHRHGVKTPRLSIRSN